MEMTQIIMKKRDGKELTKEEIHFFVSGYVKGTIPDYQVSALLMAIYFNGLNKRETTDLTLEMRDSGEHLDLSKIEGVKVDKHSTGGIGDKTTLVVGPMVASLGIPVAKMSGRALGNEGGTIDKLESIKNFNVNMSMEKFTNNVNNNKFAVSAQTAELAPADKKIYALRDVTGTVDSIPLIASSIMSKKLATGADCLVLDVTTGDGSFLKTVESAEELAHEMTDIGEAAGIKTVACITDMSQPLGYAIGNALEVKEAVETLRGKGPGDVLEIALTLGSYMVYLSGAVDSVDEAREKLKNTIDDGSAYNKFLTFVAAQGGDVSCIEDLSKMPTAKHVYPVVAPKDGYVTKIMASELGRASMELGAGRQKKDEPIDYAVGLVLNKKLGDRVKQGETLVYLHYNDDKKLKEEIDRVTQSYVISDTPDEKPPLVHKIIANKKCNL